MRDDKHTTFELFQRLDESGLVQTDDGMRTTPCRNTENDLDLVATGQTMHGVVRYKLGLETEVREVLLDLATNEGTEKTETRC